MYMFLRNKKNSEKMQKKEITHKQVKANQNLLASNRTTQSEIITSRCEHSS